MLADRSLIWLSPERHCQSPDKYRGGSLQPTIRLSLRVPDGRVGEGTEKARPPGAPGDWTTNQRIHMEGPMVLPTYVVEDGLVGHQLEEWPSGLRVFNAPL